MIPRVINNIPKLVEIGEVITEIWRGGHEKWDTLNPKYARYGGKEVIEATSKVSATENYATVQQITSRAITTTVSEAADLTGADIAQLVEEEKEDVDNTLKMLPPRLNCQTRKI
ncbi:hypothetical protein NQ317_018744 [Molorchus minor]|uniref:Uncharacterized protein n=1 Tax=Molorchus minor TaxID=1323400 RepID=A0ABQ9JHF2_9CUCU|nr:hypothetical protein NQ317_018744 [Molorchus minor]